VANRGRHSALAARGHAETERSAVEVLREVEAAQGARRQGHQGRRRRRV